MTYLNWKILIYPKRWHFRHSCSNPKAQSQTETKIFETKANFFLGSDRRKRLTNLRLLLRRRKSKWRTVCNRCNFGVPLLLFIPPHFKSLSVEIINSLSWVVLYIFKSLTITFKCCSLDHSLCKILSENLFDFCYDSFNDTPEKKRKKVSPMNLRDESISTHSIVTA